MSSRALRPRLLASEEPRQYIASGISVAVTAAWFLLSQARWPDVSGGLTIEFVSLLITAYGLMLFVNAVVYVPLAWWGFRDLEGEELAHMARLSSPRTEADRRRQRRMGVSEQMLAASVAVLSLACVVLLLFMPDLRDIAGVSLAALGAVLGSWVLIAVSYGMRYLRAWAEDESVTFPGSLTQLRFSDFLFLSVQLTTGYGNANAEFRTGTVRQIATLHNLLAFAFNSVIIALLITVALPAIL